LKVRSVLFELVAHRVQNPIGNFEVHNNAKVLPNCLIINTPCVLQNGFLRTLKNQPADFQQLTILT
jgi:hypothetical protein